MRVTIGLVLLVLMVCCMLALGPWGKIELYHIFGDDMDATAQGVLIEGIVVICGFLVAVASALGALFCLFGER